MRTINFPPPSQWPALCERPALEAQNLTQAIAEVMERVRTEGDAAVRDYTARWDGYSGPTFELPRERWAGAAAELDEELKAAIELALTNIQTFHAAQASEELVVETAPGVVCTRRSVPIERVGLYIPGGSAPLFSTLLMLGVPAKLAGCEEIILCTPPNAAGEVHPAILYAADRVGVDRLFLVGGAQAIAAMTYGTERVPRVDKIFGPGNQYVTKAKEWAQWQGVAIDMPAGPSEVLVVADEGCNAEFVAADLLSQAEHGPDSQVVLVTTSERFAAQVRAEVGRQLEELPRREIARQALSHARFIVLATLEECMAFSNTYAPEHLIIALADPAPWADRVRNAGSVFLGPYSCESAGDYASGTNHTLPTGGHARAYSGVSLESFMKKITFQTLSARGIRGIGPAIEALAAAEGLDAHRLAVTRRLNALKPDANV